jgi:CheY-like chemotaxis protein
MLKGLDMDAYVASTGEEGLNCLHETNGIDAVLLDVNLPDGSGGQFADRIRNAFPKTPIIFFTGGTTPETTSGQESLSKPFSKADLKTVLERVIRKNS